MPFWTRIADVSKHGRSAPALIEVQERLLDSISRVFAIVGLVSIVPGSIYAASQGFWIHGLVYLVLYVVLVGTTTFFKQLGFALRAGLFLGGFYFVAATALLRLGLNGVGVMLLVGVCSLTAMLWGLRVGLRVIGLCLVTIAVIGWGIVTGAIEFTPVQAGSSLSATAWAITGATFAGVTAGLLFSFQALYDYLSRSLVSLEARTKELKRSNDQLTDEVERREAAEVAQKRSEQRYRSIFETMPVSIWEEDMTELSRELEQLKADGVEDFEAYLQENPETAMKLVAMIKVLDVNNATAKLYHAENKEELLRSLHRVIVPESIQPLINMISAFSRGERFFEFEGINQTLQGERLDVLLTATLPQGQEPCVAVVSIMDMTERKRLEEQLRQSEKMEAIGTLAGGIAHDFNNLLMGIQGCASLLMLKLGADQPNLELAKTIEELVDSGSQLTSQLLGFARRGKYQVRPSDLNALVKNSAAVFGRARKEIGIHQKLSPDLRLVDVDQRQIEQALLNLYVNAWQAMSSGGDLFLETKSCSLEEGKATGLGIEAGDYAALSVVDTGVGMDEATLERIFEPFFTTKEMGRGTGLGLASVYGIITNHGGAVMVESELGKGSTFTIFLPLSTREELAEPEESHEASGAGTETILLVDDETAVLQVSKSMLKELGYHVLTASGGREAVRVFEERSDAVELVILDMVMPDMSGAEVFEHIQSICPQAQVLLSSGYSLDGKSEHLLERGCQGFIQKPFRLEVLGRKVREILDRPKADS